MISFKKIFIFILFFIDYIFYAQNVKMATINRGAFVPLYGTTSKKPVQVASFSIDIYPVTNAQYLAFVKKNPAYSRSQMKALFADKSYLYQWQGDYNYG